MAVGDNLSPTERLFKTQDFEGIKIDERTNRNNDRARRIIKECNY